ncbi:MAG TPA: glycosyltransferase family 39 protein, partial [Micromonosporaceae bacterium]|nr:glycosyltransferase family 39 protein [Micromonosporaceae bacterium]
TASTDTTLRLDGLPVGPTPVTPPEAPTAAFAETDLTGTEPTGARPAETEPAETESAETESAEAAPAGTGLAEAAPAGTEPVEDRLTQAPPAETEPAGTEPAETEPAGTGPAGTGPVEPGPAGAGPAVAEVVEREPTKEGEKRPAGRDATATPAVRARRKPNIVLRFATWAVPAAVAAVIGQWGLNATAIDRDETATIDIGTRTVPQMWQFLQHNDVMHGLYYLVMHYVMGAYGTTPTVVRMPSLIAVACAAAMLAVLGTRMISYPAGFLAGLLYAGAPQISLYAHDARSYGFDSLVVISATYLFVRAMSSRTRWTWLGYGVVVTVMVCFHAFTILLLVAHCVTVVWHAVRQRDWRPVRRWLATMVGVGAALTPLAYLSLEQSHLLSWVTPPTWGTVGNYFVLVSGGTLLIAPMFALAVLAFRWRGTGNPAAPSVYQVAWPWLLIPPALLLAVSAWYAPYYVFRYVLYSLPALMLLVAAGLDKLRLRVGLPFRLHLGLPVAVALLVLMYPMQQTVRDPNQGANDTRGEAAVLTEYKQPGDAILFLLPGQRFFENSYPIAYAGLYDLLLNQTQAETGTFSGTNVDDDTLRARLAGVDRVWAVKYWDWAKNRDADNIVIQERYNQLRAAGLRWTATIHFRGGAFLLFVRPAPKPPPPHK